MRIVGRMQEDVVVAGNPPDTCCSEAEVRVARVVPRRLHPQHLKTGGGYVPDSPPAPSDQAPAQPHGD